MTCRHEKKYNAMVPEASSACRCITYHGTNDRTPIDAAPRINRLVRRPTARSPISQNSPPNTGSRVKGCEYSPTATDAP